MFHGVPQQQNFALIYSQQQQFKLIFSIKFRQMEYSVALSDTPQNLSKEDGSQFINRYQSTICSLMEDFEQINAPVEELWRLKKIVDAVFELWDQSSDDFIYDVCVASVIAYYDTKNTEAGQSIKQKIKNIQCPLVDHAKASVGEKSRSVIERMTSTPEYIEEPPNSLCVEENGQISNKNRKIVTKVLKFLYSSVQTANLSSLNFIVPTVLWINSKKVTAKLKVKGLEDNVCITSEGQIVLNVLSTVPLK